MILLLDLILNRRNLRLGCASSALIYCATSTAIFGQDVGSIFYCLLNNIIVRHEKKFAHHRYFFEFI